MKHLLSWHTAAVLPLIAIGLALGTVAASFQGGAP